MRRLAAPCLVAAVAMVAVSACSAEAERPVEAHALVAPQPTGPASGDPRHGRRLYVESCAACHGDEGEGGFGPDLRSSLVAADLSALVEQIEQGQGDMPAFGQTLTTAEINDIAAFVHARMARRGDEPVQPVQPETGQSPTAAPAGADLDLGGTIFAQNCASCHGSGGEGTDLAPPIPADMGFTDMQTVVMGGATGMPAFSQFLGAEEIEAVTAYAVKELPPR